MVEFGSRQARRPIYGIDFIRFFAASLVIIYHFGFKSWSTPHDQLLAEIGRRPELPMWWPFTWWGWIGVQIFFVISGMVISYSTDGAAPLPFARRRILRLVPTAWICATFALLVALTAFHMPPHEAGRNYLRVMAFSPWGPWLLGQFWTLPIEICFYGFICLRVHQHLEPLAWALALLSTVYFLLVDGYGVHDPNGRVSALLLLQHGGYFALGIILTRADLDGWRVRHLALIGLCVGLAVVQIADAAAGERPMGGLERDWIVPFFVWLVSVGGIAGSLHWKDRFAKVFQNRDGFVRMMGLLTYPLYLIHMHAGGPAFIYLVRRGYPAAAAIIVPAILGVVVAFIVVKYLEPPLNRMIARALSFMS